MRRAGLPTTSAWAGTSRITTAPAPTSASWPTVMPQTIVALAPIDAPFCTSVGSSASGPRLMCARGHEVVGEDRVGADEHVVLERDADPDEDRVLDRDPVADDGAALDEGVVADVAVGADLRARQDVGEGPDPGARPDVVALAQRLRVDEHALRCVGSRARRPW